MPARSPSRGVPRKADDAMSALSTGVFMVADCSPADGRDELERHPYFRPGRAAILRGNSPETLRYEAEAAHLQAVGGLGRGGKGASRNIVSWLADGVS